MPEKETLHSRIQKYILSLIETGEKKPGDKLPTEYELAQMFQTSRTTVLRALDQLTAQGVIYKRRGSGSYVSDQTDASRTDLPIISLILPFSQNQDYTEAPNEYLLLRGCQSYLVKKGYMLTISYTSESFEDEFQIIGQCKKASSKGVILYPSSNIDTLSNFYSLMLDDFPIVLIDQPLISLECSFVLSDNKSGGMIAADHLIETGCDNFSFVCETNTFSHFSLQDRYFGFCRSLKQHGYSIDKTNYFVDCLNQAAAAGQTVTEYFKQVLTRITSEPAEKYGIFCTSDAIAAELLAAASALGLDVPQKLAVIGYSSSAQRQDYPLTTISQDFYAIGENAARELLKIIRHTAAPGGFHARYIPVHLSRGQTT